MFKGLQSTGSQPPSTITPVMMRDQLDVTNEESENELDEDVPF